MQVALLSGLLSSQMVWGGVTAHLGDDVTPIPFDFPDMDSLAAMADHVLSSVEGHFAVVGHSMGGRVALEIARQAPHRLTGLAMLNSGVHPTRPAEFASRGTLVDLAREKGMAALCDRWLPPMVGNRARGDATIYGPLRQMVIAQTATSFAAQTRALLSRPDGTDTLRGLRIPILLLSAQHDGWAPPEQHRAMQRLNPMAEHETLIDTGHFSPAESGESTAAVLRPWLASLARHLSPT